MAAEATVNYIGFHEVKGDNVIITEDIATWNPVASGAAIFSEQPLRVGVPVEVEIRGSGHLKLGIISTDPKKLNGKPLCRLEDIPQYIHINEVQFHKMECRITASLWENKVVTTYNGKKFTHTIKPGMKIWLAFYVKFGDITLKLDSCEASRNYNTIFSAVKGPNLQIADDMTEVRTISSNPAAVCFIKNTLKVNQRMSFTCEPLPDGRTERRATKRFHLTVYITEADPLQSYRQRKDIFTASAAQALEPGCVYSVTMGKSNCNGRITIDRAPDSIIFTDTSNKEVRKQVHLDHRTKLWVALELFRVSVRQVEVVTLTEDPGAAQGCILHVDQQQQHLHNERPYLDVIGTVDTLNIELNIPSQLGTSTPRDEKTQFRSSYNGQFSKLVQDLDPVGFCDELMSLEIITMQQYEEIIKIKTTCDKNRHLLLLLCKRPVTKLQFISSLQKSGNGHLVQTFFHSTT
ncbi:hypothetical protein CHS0354_037280 [Potamilus streckersoni]|uniref:Uncharacterized protein n=1 Tax=Potamilus streckersoni TaxID=2493646 RepID=A0AAE0SXN3_9BIVA|nr:hypothetical protein CHS0354_037280 [Potamilus streckersoni]